MSPQRFDKDGKKLGMPVATRRTLNIGSFTCEHHAPKNVDELSSKTAAGARLVEYSLVALIEHTGADVRSGHYFAYVNKGTPRVGYWQKCDDSAVSDISEQEVLKREAYILFYRKTRSAPTLV